MRRLALAALFAAAPAAARAQGAVLQTFHVAGCATGPLFYADVRSPPVVGEVGCFRGSATLFLTFVPGSEADPAGPVPLVQLRGELTPAFAPAFAPRGLVRADFVQFLFAFDRVGGCGAGGCPGRLEAGGSVGGDPFSFAPGSGAAAAFATVREPLPRDVILGSLRDFRGRGELAYALANSPSGATTEFAPFSFTLTAVPEPTTLALAGAGVLLLGAWARRRTRAA
jgi:hypothetical protein